MYPNQNGRMPIVLHIGQARPGFPFKFLDRFHNWMLQKNYMQKNLSLNISNPARMHDTCTMYVVDDLQLKTYKKLDIAKKGVEV